MKTLFLILAIVVGLLLAHNYFQTGEFGLSSSLSETEKEIKRLEERLEDAHRAYRVAGRGSAIGGMDGSAAAESALGSVRAVERDLESVRQQVSTEPERVRLEALEQRLKEVKRELGVN